MRRTKIIATLGPATSSPAALTELIALGVNVFRFNMSHAPHDWVRTVAKSIRDISARCGTEVALHAAARHPHAELYMRLVETSVGQIPSTVTAAALSGADVTSTTRPVRLTGARCSVTVPRFAGKNASG